MDDAGFTLPRPLSSSVDHPYVLNLSRLSIPSGNLFKKRIPTRLRPLSPANPLSVFTSRGTRKGWAYQQAINSGRGKAIEIVSLNLKVVSGERGLLPCSLLLLLLLLLLPLARKKVLIRGESAQVGRVRGL